MQKKENKRPRKTSPRDVKRNCVECKKVFIWTEELQGHFYNTGKSKYMCCKKCYHKKNQHKRKEAKLNIRELMYNQNPKSAQNLYHKVSSLYIGI